MVHIAVVYCINVPNADLPVAEIGAMEKTAVTILQRIPGVLAEIVAVS